MHNKETQTSLEQLPIYDKSAQYSAASEASETDYISDETQCPYHDTQFKHTELPQYRNRTSTPIPDTQVPRHTIEEIIHHPQAFQVPPVEIVVALGQQAANQAVNSSIQRV